MLLLQCLLYWASFLYLALWLWRDTSKSLLALTAVLVPFLPFLINFTGVVWKDTHLAIALFWAALLLVFGKTSWSKLLISLLFIFYGLSVRHNGIAAALPLLILWSYRYCRLTDSNSTYGVVLVTSIILLIYLIFDFNLNNYFSVQKTHPVEYQRLNEIIFIKCHSDSKDFSMLEKYYGKHLTRIKPQHRQKYLCDQVSVLANTDDTNKIYDDDIVNGKILRPLNGEPDPKGKEILDLWIQNVRSHPWLYLDYRFQVYRTFLRPFGYSEPYNEFMDGMDKDSIPPKLPFTILNPFGLSKLLRHYVEFFANSKYFQLPFRPFFWLITLAITTLLALYKRQRSMFFIAVSGLLYLILYFPNCRLRISGTATIRYSHRYC